MLKHLLLLAYYYPFRYYSWENFQRYRYHLYWFRKPKRPEIKYSLRALKQEIERIKNS